MDILFIQPHYQTKPTFFELWAGNLFKFTADFTLQQLAAITPPEHTTDLLVEQYKPINYDDNYDIVGITCLTPTAIRVYEIADEFRRRGVKVVLGGYHPSALPEEAKQHADSVVIGEAEVIWPQLLKDIENDKILPFYRNVRPINPELIPPAKRSNKKNAFNVEAIQATRGCPTGCEFCAITNMEFRRVFRPRPLNDVIEEIKSIPCRSLIFYDNSLTINVEYTKSLFREMRDLNKTFICYGNVNILGKDDELLKLASEAGCLVWHIGFDSISQQAMDNVGKTTNKVEEYAKAVKKIHDYNMGISGSFIFGFDEDTPDIFNRTLDATTEWEIDSIDFNTLRPLPGTPLFNRFEKEGRILTRAWSKYIEGNVVFQPKNMTVEELNQGVRGIIKEAYSYTAYMKRIFRGLRFGISTFKGIMMSNFETRSYYKSWDIEV